MEKPIQCHVRCSYIRVFFSGNNNYIFLWKQLYYLSVSIKSSNLVARLIEIKNEGRTK